MRVEADVWFGGEGEDEGDSVPCTIEIEEGPGESDISIHIRDGENEVRASISLDDFLRGWLAGQFAAYQG